MKMTYTELVHEANRQRKAAEAKKASEERERVARNVASARLTPEQVRTFKAIAGGAK